jgi:hypothetical protein
VSGWFPRVNAQGRVVSGAGVLFLDGQPLGEIGWNPVWFNDGSFIYNAARDGLRIYDLASRKSFQLDARELIELAAGGGMWAGRHAPSNTLVVSGGGEIPGAGQPCLSSRGELIYRVGDDKIEPSICLTAAAWGDGRGRIIAHTGQDVTVGPFEARPVLIDTPSGSAWVLCMTRTGFHLRPLSSNVGYWINTGEDHNINAHAVCIGTVIKCVWQDTQGHLFDKDVDLSEPRVQLPVSGPIVLPDPPKPEEPPVSEYKIPEDLRDQRDTVIEVRNRLFPPDKYVDDRDDLATWAKEIARELKRKYRTLPIGLARAKPGSDNHGGPTAAVPEGFVTDIVCIANGVHWDFKADGGRVSDNAALWNLEDDERNYPPIADRFVPIEKIESGGGDNGDPGDEDPPKPPVEVPVCNCAADLKQIRGAMAELEQVMVDAAKAANERITKLEYFAVMPLVARGKFYGLKIELPVEPK